MTLHKNSDIIGSPARALFFFRPQPHQQEFTPLGHPCRLRHRWPSVYKTEAHLCCLQWLQAPSSKMIEVVHDRLLIMPEPMNGINPVLIFMDMLPGGTDESDPPGLTLGCIPMPCLSRTPIGPFGSVCRQWGRVPITETHLVRFAARAHSPELPQLSTVQLEMIPWTALDRN